MTNPKQRHGNHTWDLILNYDKCPKCHYIIENRNKFERRLNQLEKDMVCPRCHQAFKIKTPFPSTFGPLLGNNPEIDE